MEELQAAVEDLEAIRDLNDELEENHVETEHQMQGEIGKTDLILVCLSIFLTCTDSMLYDSVDRSEGFERTRSTTTDWAIGGELGRLREYDRSISRACHFSATVRSPRLALKLHQSITCSSFDFHRVHRDLEESRQHRADQEPESQSLKSQSQAMMSLNLKLQSSVLKGQVKTIELDLRKLDASQAVERLSIIRVHPSPSRLHFPLP